MPGLYRILVVTVLKWQNAPLFNKKELHVDTANGTALATITGTHPDIFFLISMLLSCLAIA